MRLRAQLLLLTLLLLLLPVSGWFTAREIQAALEAAEGRASLAAAASLARALARDFPAVPEPDRALRVHAAPAPRLIDGFEDDWAPWLESAQRFRARTTELAFDLNLASYGRRLFGLLRVRDRTTRAGGRPGDEVQLAFGDGWILRITPGIPGGARVERLAGPAGDQPLRAVWHTVSDGGYRVEFAVPRSLTSDRLTITVLDFGEGLPGSRPAVAAAGSTARPGVLVLPDPSLAVRLAELAPAGHRLWVTDRERWVLAVAGELRPAPLGLRGWRRKVYRWVGGDRLPPDRSARDPRIDLRLAGPEVDAALAGLQELELRAPPDPAAGLLASSAVPLRQGERIVGALVVESSGETLLLSAGRAFFGTVVLSTLLAIAVAVSLLVYAGWLSLRIRRLRDGAEAVAAGDAPALPVERAGDELADLSRSFGGLLDQLHEYNRYLQGLAGRLAHELDTPLTIVRSSLENLRAEALPPTATPYLTRASEGADRLAAIFRAMREARRLEETVEGAERERLDLRALLTSCQDAYRVLDPAHPWSLDLVPAPVAVQGAPELLVQALDKLVDNARSFAPAGAAITLFLRFRGRGVLLGVANDGPPLPDRMGRQLFDSMVSLRPAGEGLHLGLGLHIVRLVARAHGGKTFARNREGGVEIGLWLPLD